MRHTRDNHGKYNGFIRDEADVDISPDQGQLDLGLLGQENVQSASFDDHDSPEQGQLDLGLPGQENVRSGFH